MTTYPYPKGKELDNLLEPRAPGLSYLWPLAVAAGLVPAGSKPSEVFQLVKTWDRPENLAATEAMKELYALATKWAWVDRVRAELADITAEKAAELLGVKVDPQARYDQWVGTQYAPTAERVHRDPNDEHTRLWHDFNRCEKALAGKLEGLCVRAAESQQQTVHATRTRVAKADRTCAFIVAEAKRMEGDRQTVASNLADIILGLDSATYSKPGRDRIINILGKEFPGDVAWEGRHK